MVRTREFNALYAVESRVSTQIVSLRRQNARLSSQLAVVKQKVEEGVPSAIAEMHRRRIERERKTVQDIGERLLRAGARCNDERRFIDELRKPPEERASLEELAMELRRNAASRHRQHMRRFGDRNKPSSEEERLLRTVARLEKQRQWWENRVTEAIGLLEESAGTPDGAE